MSKPENLSEVLFEMRGNAGVITLNRPKALNAVTLGMVREMTEQLQNWRDDSSVKHVIIRANGEKAFSAGGDIVALYKWGLAGDEQFLSFYEEEYQLNNLIKTYPKPYIALMNGIAMGGGVGVSVNGSHRVGTEKLTFAMPETGIGLFPDVGGTYFLPRCPGELGVYKGLTGARIKAADALYTGIITHHVCEENLDALCEALCETGNVEETLQTFSEDAGHAPLKDIEQQINASFAFPTIEEIRESLTADGSDWALKTLKILDSKSPTSLKITLRQLRLGKNQNFQDCMRTEFRIVNRIFKAKDFFEGTRAVVIDKDQQPKWSPAKLNDVTDDMIDPYFAPLEKELQL